MRNNALKLVYDRDRQKDRYEVLSERSTIQGTLFPENRKGMLIFVAFPNITECDFRGVIEHTTPGMVFELRPVPRFDIGRMNRQTAFEFFQLNGTRYIELTPADGTELCWDQVLEELRGVKERFDVESRPVVFLVNADALDDGQIKRIASTLKRSDDSPWRICEVPTFRLPEEGS